MSSSKSRPILAITEFFGKLPHAAATASVTRPLFVSPSPRKLIITPKKTVTPQVAQGGDVEMTTREKVAVVGGVKRRLCVDNNDDIDDSRRTANGNENLDFVRLPSNKALLSDTELCTSDQSFKRLCLDDKTLVADHSVLNAIHFNPDRCWKNTEPIRLPPDNCEKEDVSSALVGIQKRTILPCLIEHAVRLSSPTANLPNLVLDQLLQIKPVLCSPAMMNTAKTPDWLTRLRKEKEQTKSCEKKVTPKGKLSHSKSNGPAVCLIKIICH